MSRKENTFYARSYLLERGLRLSQVNELSRLLVNHDDNDILVTPNRTIFELIFGIIQKIGHQYLAYDSIRPMEYKDYPRMEYHFDYFIVTTKSIFDYVGHLINEMLELRFTGRNIDLSKSDFTNEISKKDNQLGSVLNGHQSWISQITRLRTALEHHKIVPILYLDSAGQASSIPHFSVNPISYTELLAWVGRSKRLPEMKEVFTFCEESLRNTKDIVEATFELTVSRLTHS